MVREDNDPADLGRKATDARRSQQQMYESLSDLAESYEKGSISVDEFKDKVGNIEDRFGVFIEGAEEDYDTVDEFARALNEDVTSVNFHYHETDRRGFSKWLAALMGATLLGAGAVGRELLEEDGSNNSSEEIDYNLSNLASDNFVGNPGPESYEGWETDYSDIGEIAEEWKDTSSLSQFGDEVQNQWLDTASDLKLGVTSVNVEETANGLNLVYEEENPDGYIGHLFDFDNDILTSHAFDSQENYGNALDIMEDYN